jgi:hypothetical protein
VPIIINCTVPKHPIIARIVDIFHSSFIRTYVTTTNAITIFIIVAIHGPAPLASLRKTMQKNVPAPLKNKSKPIAIIIPK